MESYLYQYLVGGAVFAAGLAAAVRTGHVGLTRGAPRLRLFTLLGGFAVFALIQGLLLWVA